MAFGSLQGIIGRAGGNEVIGRAVIDVGVSSYRIRHDMRTVTRAINTEAQFWGKAFRLAGVGLAAMGAAAAAAVVGSIAAAEKFNKSMARIVAMTGVAESEIGKMREGIMKLSVEVGRGPSELADALYFIASAGFRGAEGLKVLEQASKAAAASGSDMEISADALVSVMNAYGLSADQAAYASDILTRTVVYGKTEFEDLAKAIGPISTISRVAGISMEEMGAAISMLTTRGLTARRATNSLWATLRSLTKPTEQQWKMMDALGIDFKPEDIKTDGLIAVLRKFDKGVKDWVKKNTGERVKLTQIYDKDGKLNLEASEKQFKKMNRGYFDQMSKLVGQSNAFLVSQILLQETGETYDFYLDKMSDSAVTTANAFEKASRFDMSIAFGQLAAKIQTVLIPLGEKFLPLLREMFKWMGDALPAAIQWFSDVLESTLAPAAKAAWEGISKLLSAIGDIMGVGEGSESPVLAFFGFFVDAAANALDVIGDVTTALAELLSNQMVQNLVRFAGLWTAIALAFSGIRTASSFMNAKTSGFLKMVSFGKLGGSKTPSSTTETIAAQKTLAASTTMMGAAQQLTIAARELMVAAQRLALGGAGGFLGPMGPQTRLPNGGFGPRGYLPGQAMPWSGPKPMKVQPGYFTGTYKNMPGIAAAGQTAGQGLLKTAATGLTGAMKSGMGLVRPLLSVGMGVISKLFWPLMITDLVGNLLKEPIGDFVSSIKIGDWDFSAAGAAMKEDFWGGVVGIVTTMLGDGPNIALEGLPDKVKIGYLEIPKSAFDYVGVDRAKIDTAIASNLAISEGDINLTTLKGAIAAENPYQGQIDAMKGLQGDALVKAQENLLQALKDGGLTDAEISALYDEVVTTSTVSGGSYYGTRKISRTVKTLNQGRLIDIASKSAYEYDQAIDGLKRQTVDYMLNMVGKTGSTEFNKGSLSRLPRTVLEELTKLAEENTDGSISWLQDWATKDALATANKVKTISATDSRFVNLKTPEEKALAAVNVNLNPVKDAYNNYADWIKENQGKVSYDLAEDWITKYGEGIGDAIRKMPGDKFVPKLALGSINSRFGTNIKQVTADMWKDLTPKQKKTIEVGDFVQVTKGKVGKEVTQAAIADYWRQIMAEYDSAFALTGRDQATDISNRVNESIIQGINDGLTIDEIKAGIPVQFWEIWMDSAGGKTGGAEAITDLFKKGIKDAGIKIPKDLETVKEPMQKKILAELNKWLPAGSQLTGTKGWETFKGMWGDPTGFESWLSAQLSAATTAGVEKFRAAFTITPEGKKRAGGVTTKKPAGGGGMATGILKGLLGDVAGAAETIFGEDAVAAFTNAGTKLVNAIAKGASTDEGKAMIVDAWHGTLTKFTDSVPQSPVKNKQSPLANNAMENAGEKIVSNIATGVTGAASILSNAANTMLTNALGSKSSVWSQAWQAGRNIGVRIAEGIRSATSALSNAMVRVAVTITDNAPYGSPAKRGPWSGPAWKAMHRAGANIVGQMALGMSQAQLSLPGLEAGGSGKLAMQTMGGPSQKIYADKIQMFNAQDEDSILKQFAFLAPGGR